MRVLYQHYTQSHFFISPWSTIRFLSPRRTQYANISVADPYHFDTDPDPGCEKIRYGSGSRVNFDTDPDQGKNDTDPDPAKKA